MNVSLPNSMKDWVEAQARPGRSSNASDYLRELIRRDQERAAKLAEPRGLITAGVESGISVRSISDVISRYAARSLPAQPSLPAP